ncbi:MAG: PepSY domain-containing protein [Flavisolibacter sp.]
MKKLSFILSAALLLLVSCGTTYNSTGAYPAYNVPSSVQTSFTTQYPNATAVSWTQTDKVPFEVERTFLDWPATGDEYVVQFHMDNTDYYAWYDANGAWIGTATAVTNYSTMPAAVNSVIANDYLGYTLTSVTRAYRDDVVVYDVNLKRGDATAKLLVDANGNVLKREEKM